MLRHWAHSKICKGMRAARGIVVDRMLSEHSLDWRDTPHLGISDSNEKQLCWSWAGEQLGDEIEESSPTDVRLLFTDDTEPTGDAWSTSLPPSQVWEL